MKLLKWAVTIKQPVPVSKEDILNKAEKAEIVCLIVGVLYLIVIVAGLVATTFAPTDSNLVFAGLAMIVVGSMGLLENVIKGCLKLERYKAIWDKLDLQQSEMRKMQAKDL